MSRVLFSSNQQLVLFSSTLGAEGQQFDLKKTISSSHLFESLPEFSSWGHSQLFCDVSRNLQKQHLHQSRHDSTLVERGEKH